MSVELTPNGTYGTVFPKAPQVIMNLAFALLTLRIRLSGGKVLTLTTTGAKSGRTHDVPLRYFPYENNSWLIVASVASHSTSPASSPRSLRTMTRIPR